MSYCDKKHMFPFSIFLMENERKSPQWENVRSVFWVELCKYLHNTEPLECWLLTV